jgi:hypothetical protein
MNRFTRLDIFAVGAMGAYHVIFAQVLFLWDPFLALYVQGPPLTMYLWYLYHCLVKGDPDQRPFLSVFAVSILFSAIAIPFLL